MRWGAIELLRVVEIGWWIPLGILAVAFLYGVWVIYQKLDRFRVRRDQLNEGLDDLLLPYRLALEKISQAEERLNAGEAQQAIELLTDLEDKSPSFPIIDYWLGKAFDDQGRRESAAQHFQKFIESCTPYDALSRDRIAEAKAFLQKNT
jgi:tetratricopeptide (TPR) repeat protein